MYSIPLFLLTKELKEHKIFSLTDIQEHQNFCRLFEKVQKTFENKLRDSQSQKSLKDPTKDKDLPSKVWSWFENLSFEQKLKICTIRNKWLLRIIIQLSFINFLDRRITLEPTSEMNSLFSTDQSYTFLCKNINIFDSNSSKKILEYNEDDYYNLYFIIKKPEFIKKKSEDEMREEYKCETKLLNNIVVLSIEKEDSLDAISLSEELLKDSKSLKHIFNFFSNKKCFGDWILPSNFNDLYNFCYPIWMHKSNNNNNNSNNNNIIFDNDKYGEKNNSNIRLSFSQIICGFFEQQILIAYEYFFYSKKMFFFSKLESICDLYEENENLGKYFLDKKSKEEMLTIELINEIINQVKSNVDYKKRINVYKKIFDQICKEYYKTEFYIGNKIWDNEGEILYNEFEEEINNNNKAKGKEIHFLLNKITFIKLNDVRNFREFIFYQLKKYFIQKREKEYIDDLLSNDNDNKEDKKKKKKKKKNRNNNKDKNNNKDNIKNNEENKIIINENNNEKNFSSNDENENSISNAKDSSNSLKIQEREEKKEIKENSNKKEEKIKNKEFFLFPINKKKNKNKNKIKNNENINNEKSLSEKKNIKINYIENKEEVNLKQDLENKTIDNKSKSKTEMNQLSETSIIRLEMLNKKNSQKNEEEKKSNNQYYMNSPESTTSFSFEASTKDKPIISKEISYQIKEKEEFEGNNINENKNQINMTINIINNQYIIPQYPFFNFDNIALMQSQFLYYYHTPSDYFFDALSKEIKAYESFTSKNIEILNKVRRKYYIKVEKMIETGLKKKYEIKFGHYGSFFTNLSIEGSDVDILVYYKPLKPNLDFLKDIINLLNDNEEEFESINPRLSASVPVIVLQINISEEIETKILKFLPYFENKDISHINIDLTFSSKEKEFKRPGLIVNYINTNLKQYEEIRPLLLVIKRYFRVMKMNKSFTGGLSSYSLFLLILAFLKYNEQKMSLSKSLYYIMEKYSFFDYKNFGIDVEGEECYFPLNNLLDSKEEEIQNNDIIDNNFDNKRVEEIKILDPFTKLNVAKSSFKLDEIKNTFNKALYFLKIESWKFQNDNINENNLDINDDFTIIKKLFSIK